MSQGLARGWGRESYNKTARTARGAPILVESTTTASSVFSYDSVNRARGMVFALRNLQKAALMEHSCSIERTAADAARIEAQSIRDDCQRDINEVLPLLHQALRALEALDKRDLQELKSFPSPPALVETVMNAVCLLLGRKETWEDAKKALNDTSLMVTLRDYDKDHVPSKVLHQLSKYTALEDFVPEKVATVSKAATSLCMWVRAVESYARVSHTKSSTGTC